jgi:NADPH:quinone reductase-like Zn-dependent oxidoreductase
MVRTEAWVLHQGPASKAGEAPVAAQLKKEMLEFSEITDFEVLAEPLYGCWEGNMSHAVERDPVDICRQRGEEKVVIGNAGVVRVIKIGAAVTTVKENDVCLVFCNGVWDELGYPIKIYAYDAPGTVGLLAKQTKLHERQLIRIPENSRHSLQQWAAFSLRYITAWANWKVAYGIWRVQVSEEERAAPFVWGWGGGVTLAELTLAKYSNCQVAMISSNEQRLKLIQEMDVRPIDRRQFSGLQFEEEKYRTDSEFREAYRLAENAFLALAREHTGGAGISIFIDFIGLPVFRATLKALARPGVVTTAGWKEGMNLSTLRAIECMSWHTHVHTHYARYADALEAVEFAEGNGWMPPLNGHVYDWNDVPQLAAEHSEGRISSYFPVYAVNAP